MPCNDLRWFICEETHGFCWFSSKNATVLNHACLQPGALDGIRRQLRYIRIHCLALSAADRRSIIATKNWEIHELVFLLQWLGLAWRYVQWASKKGWTLPKPTPLHSAWHRQPVFTLSNAYAIEKSSIAHAPASIYINNPSPRARRSSA